MPTSGMNVQGPARRSRMQWVAAAALFIASAALLAVRSMPSNMDAEVLSVLSWSVTVSFALACLLAALALWSRSRGDRGAAVSTAVFGAWVFTAPLLLSISTSDVVLLADAVAKIITGGVAVACLLRSSLPSPWRALPAVTFGIVIAGTLLVQPTLSNQGTMDAAIVAGNLLLLVKVGASVVLGVAALRFGRMHGTTTIII